LIEDGKVALIERHRAGRHYYVFPGGGKDEGETPEQAAIREMEEETGLQVTILRKVAQIFFGLSEQVYYLVDRLDGKFGTGTGEEFTDSDPNDLTEGVYVPVWMSLEELAQHDNVYPADVAVLVIDAVKNGWPEEPILVVEDPR
jgi:8-oxo-dGTP diphosphatase